MTDMELDATRSTGGMEGDLEDAGDADVEILVEGIEDTRTEMTLTVEEIGDRLDPKNIVADAKDTVRAATVGKVEDMANTAGAMVSDAGETVREAGSGIVDTITRNPIPAALAGIGIGWLVLSGRSSSQSQGNAYGSRYNASGYNGNGYGNGQSTMGQLQHKAGRMADDVGSTVGDAAEHVGQTVGQAADQVGQVAGQVPDQVRTMATQVSSEAGRMFQQNPMAMGAIAVAVGAAVGLALPVTETERRAIRQPAQQIVAKAEEVASDALGQVEETARDAEQSARDEELQARPH